MTTIQAVGQGEQKRMSGTGILLVLFLLLFSFAFVNIVGFMIMNVAFGVSALKNSDKISINQTETAAGTTTTLQTEGLTDALSSTFGTYFWVPSAVWMVGIVALFFLLSRKSKGAHTT